jgi:hypothetical protein
MFHMFYLPSNGCWIDFVPSLKVLLLILLSCPSVFVHGAPCALIVKIKSNQSQGWEATLVKVLHSHVLAPCPGTDGRVGA